MMNNPKPISEFLVPGKRAHLVGIGGVSMCPLAEVLAGKGLLVQGSDMTESDSVKHLRSKGISVAIGHNAENLGDCDFVIRTAAVHDGNPEIAGAIARGIPVYERAQAWGALMRKYPNALCVSGTSADKVYVFDGVSVQFELNCLRTDTSCFIYLHFKYLLFFMRVRKYLSSHGARFPDALT